MTRGSLHFESGRPPDALGRVDRRPRQFFQLVDDLRGILRILLADSEASG